MEQRGHGGIGSGVRRAVLNSVCHVVRLAGGAPTLAFPFAVLLTGCTLEGLPNPLVPAAPPQFRAAASLEAPPVPADWPHLFGAPELGRLADATLAGNFDIAAAVARIEQAEAQAIVAASPLYPQLQGTSDGQRQIAPGTAHARQGPFRSSASNLFSLGVNASYALDFFGRNAQAAEAGRLNADASHYDRDTVALTTLASLCNAYFAMLSAQDRLRVARENIASASMVLDAIQARVGVGTATELDISQQETVLANQRANVPVLEQTLQQSRNNLALLAGRTPESVALRGGTLARLSLPHVRPGLPVELLLRRPDVAAAEARLAAQNADVRAARAAFFPTITLTGSAGLESMTLVNLLRPEALAASFASGLTQPIFNGHNLEGLEKEAEGRYRELLADYRKSIVQALTDVENALIAVKQTGEQVRLTAAAAQSARRSYTIVQARLREGTIDIVTVLNTEQSLFQAQDSMIQAELARAQAMVSLFQALGGGFATRPVAPAPSAEEMQN